MVNVCLENDCSIHFERVEDPKTSKNAENQARKAYYICYKSGFLELLLIQTNNKDHISAHTQAQYLLHRRPPFRPPLHQGNLAAETRFACISQQCRLAAKIYIDDIEGPKLTSFLLRVKIIDNYFKHVKT